MRTAATVIALAGLALAAAGCGSSSPRHSARFAETLRYSQCMRGHGIGDFPDPTASGDLVIQSAGPNSDLDRDNPAFQAADNACRRYNAQPAVTPVQHTQLANAYLRFARCMRSHGVSDFPDPITGSGGHPGFAFTGGPNSDVNRSNPAFRRAGVACQHILGHEFRFAFMPSGVGKGG